jgi:hypothetical protein
MAERKRRHSCPLRPATTQPVISPPSALSWDSRGARAKEGAGTCAPLCVRRRCGSSAAGRMRFHPGGSSQATKRSSEADREHSRLRRSPLSPPKVPRRTAASAISRPRCACRRLHHAGSGRVLPSARIRRSGRTEGVGGASDSRRLQRLRSIRGRLWNARETILSAAASNPRAPARSTSRYGRSTSVLTLNGGRSTWKVPFGTSVRSASRAGVGDAAVSRYTSARAKRRLCVTPTPALSAEAVLFRATTTIR